jgi:hypothetical protein
VVAITESLVSLLYKYYIHLVQNVITATATTDNFCTNGSQSNIPLLFFCFWRLCIFYY